MKNNYSTKYIKDFFIIFCVIFFIFFLVILQGQFSCFFDDDYSFSSYAQNETFFDCLNFNYPLLAGHGSGYIGLFLNKFFMFGLPNILGIHPIDFSGIPYSFIRAFFVAFILFFSAKYVNVFFKSKSLFSATFLLITLYMFFEASNSDAWVLVINYNFYRYLFSLIFFAIFWFYLYRNILSSCKFWFSKRELLILILTSICGFILGTSSEILFFSSIALVCLILVYNLFIFIISKLLKNKWCFDNNKFNLDCRFFISSFFLFLGTYLFTSTESFVQIATIDRKLSFSVDFNYVINFFNLFWTKCFVETSIYWFFLIFILLFILFKKFEIKKIIFPILMLVSILVVMFSLIFCGDTFYGANYITHSNISFLYRMVIIYPFLLLLSYAISLLFKSKMNKKLKRIIYSLVIWILLLSSLFFFYGIFIKNAWKYSEQRALMKEAKTCCYIIEKVARFYYLQQKVPELPQHRFTLYSHTIKGVTDVQYNNIYSTSYYPRIYKTDISINLGYKFTDDAIEKFYSLGGIFSKTELDKLCFKNLFDEQFVLNNKNVSDTMSIDELKTYANINKLD